MGTTAHIIRSVFTLGLAQILTWVGSGLMTILLPRYLGDVNLGKLTFAFALTSLVGLFADLGATTYLTREVARDQANASRLAVNLLVMRIPLSILLALGTIVYASLAGYDDSTRELVSVISIGIVVMSLSSVVNGTLQGLQRMKPMAITSVLTKVGYAVAAAALLIMGTGALAVAVAYVVFGAVGLVYSGAVLMRHVRLTAPITFHAWRALLIAGMPFFVWQAALLIYGQIDTVLLSFLTTDAVVGWYALSYRLVMIPVFIPTIIVTVVFPALAAATGTPKVFAAISRKAVQVISLVTMPMALGIMLLPDKIIHLFGYPVSFDNSVVPLVLLAPHLPLAAIDTMIGTVLNARDRQRQWAMIGVAAAVLNPLINFFVIPYAQATFGNGAIGAATITTLTEVFMMVNGLRLLPKGILGMSTLSDVLKCVVACAAMSTVVWLLRDLPIAVPVAAGVITYAFSCLVVGAVSIGDLKEIHLQLLRGRTQTQVAPTQVAS